MDTAKSVPDFQPSDARGVQILDWMLENNIGGFSTPDITFVSPTISTKAKWAVVDETAMGSDHYPIIIEIKGSDIGTISTTPLRTSWRSKNVDWSAFRSALPRKLSLMTVISHLPVGS